MVFSCFGVLNWCKEEKNLEPSKHKGVLRDDTQVAIKCLSSDSRQGANEFLTEINTISRIRHPNLVKLFGCCVEGNHRILVYEYLENNSLASSLLGSRSHVSLDWPQRAAICLGTAIALHFFMTKLNNKLCTQISRLAIYILLYANFRPKIGHFGLAKHFSDNVTHLRASSPVAWLGVVNSAELPPRQFWGEPSFQRLQAAANVESAALHIGEAIKKRLETI